MDGEESYFPMGEGMAYGGLPFLHTGGPVPDIYIYHVSDMINVWDTVSTFIHLPRIFLLMNILFWTMDWIIYNGPPLYHIYILNLGLSAGWFQAMHLVLLVAFGAVD